MIQDTQQQTETPTHPIRAQRRYRGLTDAVPLRQRQRGDDGVVLRQWQDKAWSLHHDWRCGARPSVEDVRLAISPASPIRCERVCVSVAAQLSRCRRSSCAVQHEHYCGFCRGSMQCQVFARQGCESATCLTLRVLSGGEPQQAGTER